VFLFDFLLSDNFLFDFWKQNLALWIYHSRNRLGNFDRIFDQLFLSIISNLCCYYWHFYYKFPHLDFGKGIDKWAPVFCGQSTIWGQSTNCRLRELFDFSFFLYEFNKVRTVHKMRTMLVWEEILKSTVIFRLKKTVRFYDL
jgi:hypothetical protein